VYRYFCDWAWDGVLDRIHDALCVKCREQAEREASPAAAIIDSQSVKSAEKGGRTSIRTAMTRENLNATAVVFLRFASIRLMLRKLCNG
jgi:transposase